MKTKIYSSNGKASKEIVLPEIFTSKIRKDLCKKYKDILTRMQAYSPDPKAGQKNSASGKLSHRRHKWKTAYGHGISRVPRKIFWRRGVQFYWQGATAPGTVGGRKAHPPKAEHFKKQKKMNKKEKRMAIFSAISATASQNHIEKRYESIEKISFSLPIIIESNLLKKKTKDFFDLIKKILNENYHLALKKKSIRAGKGKMRNRKYKSNAGLLLVIGKNENKKAKGVDVVRANELSINELWPLGRLVIYTEQAIKDLNDIWNENKNEEKK